jgi:Uma2 family endonuclease
MSAMLQEPPVLEQPEQEEDEGKMASEMHSLVALNMALALKAYTKPRKLGRVYESSASFKMVGEPKKRQPDAAFVRKERLGNVVDKEIPFAPDLAVEVVSQNDTFNEVKEKVLHYFASGTELVWVVSLITQSVQIFRQATGAITEEKAIDQFLDGEQVVPGFKVAIAELFDYE